MILNNNAKYTNVFPSSHVEFMVAHAQSENSFVDAKTSGIEYKVGRFLIGWLLGMVRWV